MQSHDLAVPTRRIFHDAEHERQALEQGYFKTRVLDDAGIAELRLVVEQVFASVKIPFEWADGAFQFTGIHSNAAFVDALYAGLTDFLKPYIDTVFIDYTQVMAGVFNKPPRTTNSDLRSHQDPSFVEPPYRTFVSWIPLVSISEENGSFFVLPGSQHLHPFRPIIQPPVFATCDRLLREVGQAIDTEVGDVVVFDTGLVHWSLANGGPNPRAAIQLVNVPAEAPFFFPFYTEGESRKRIELYQMPMDDVRRHAWYRPERPTGYPLIKSIDYEFVNLSEGDLIEQVGPYNPRLAAMRGSVRSATQTPTDRSDGKSVPHVPEGRSLYQRARSVLHGLGIGSGN